MATILARDLCLDSLKLKVKTTELRASDAEEIARMADARAAEALERAQTTERRAAVAEEKVAATEEKAVVAEAVECFRGSTVFLDELVKASVDVFHHSFQDCKEKAARVFGILGILDLEPDIEELGESSSERRPADDGPAPADA